MIARSILAIVAATTCVSALVARDVCNADNCLRGIPSPPSSSSEIEQLTIFDSVESHITEDEARTSTSRLRRIFDSYFDSSSVWTFPPYLGYVNI